MIGRNFKLLIIGVKVALWLIKAPFIFTYKLYRLVGRGFGFWLLNARDSFICPGCGDEISLVGRWSCGWCNFVFDGFFFDPCNVCGAVPPYIECQACGSGVRNPVLFP